MLVRLLLVVPAAALLLTPFALLAAAVAEQPGILATLADKPLSTLQLGIGLVISILFCGLPLSRTLDRVAADVRPSATAPASPLPATPLDTKAPLRLAA